MSDRQLQTPPLPQSELCACTHCLASFTFSCSACNTHACVCSFVICNELFLCSISRLLCSTYLREEVKPQKVIWARTQKGTWRESLLRRKDNGVCDKASLTEYVPKQLCMMQPGIYGYLGSVRVQGQKGSSRSNLTSCIWQVSSTTHLHSKLSNQNEIKVLQSTGD